MKANRGRGFTLIELLIVVAIIGILVAISMVNYFNAIGRAKQRRTMADMRTLSAALEAYAADLNRYPPAAAFSLPPGLTLPTTTMQNAIVYLQPTYIKIAPLADGWNSWFTYGTTTEGTDYCIRSAADGGVAETTPAYGSTTSFKADIIYVNGAFVQYPEGIQR